MAIRQRQSKPELARTQRITHVLEKKYQSKLFHFHFARNGRLSIAVNAIYESLFC